jgi:G3E family GTPase
MLRFELRVASLFSTVDALNGMEQVETQHEAMRQAATADRLVITKTDLSDDRQIEQLHQRLKTINPMALIWRSPATASLWDQILSNDSSDQQWRISEADSISRVAAMTQSDVSTAPRPLSKSEHLHSTVSFALRFCESIDWSPFVVWLSLLVHRHGRNILRVKGLLDVPGAKGPILLNAVQHFIHRPVHLDGWPDDDRTSRLVFIVQGLEEAAVRRSLTDFLRRASNDAQVAAEAV